MNSLIASRNYRLQRSVFLSGLVCMLMMSACTPDSTPTATSVPTPVPVSIPTIVPSRPCELSPGVTIPLAVTGVAGTGVVYTWHASAGSVIPPDGPAVAYTAPNMAGDVIISVMAQKGDQASTGMITCRVVVTPTPIPSATSTTAPTATPTPAPTATATPLPSRTPPPATLAPPLCEGSTSADLIGKAWAGDPETRLACARLIIDRWTGAADTQQAERLNNGLCTVTPDPADAQAVKQFFTEYYAVNDVGTAWFLRGEALKRLGRTTEARAAYKTVIDKYSCAYAFAADGKSFWRVADAAQGQ